MAGDELAQLVERAELELAAGDVDAATERLLDVAGRLPAATDRPGVVGRALWLVALISLSRGSVAEFVRHADGAIESLGRAGDTAAVEHARRLYDEIARRIDADVTVQQSGATGLLAVLELQLERALERAETDGTWELIDRDRAQLAQLLGAAATGEEQPLARVLVRLGFDQVAAVALIILVPLCTSPVLRRRALALVGDDPERPGVPAGLVAGLAFAHLGAQQDVMRRLAPGSPLRRLGVVRGDDSGPPELERLDIAPSVLWYLHGAGAVDLPRPAGVSIVQSPAGVIAVDPLHGDNAGRVARWAGLEPAPPLLVLAGRRGSGKSTLVAAAAAETGRPLIAVDADAVSWEAWDATLHAVARDGLMTDAVVYLRCDGIAPPLQAIAGFARLRLAIGVRPGQAAPVIDALRAVRADVVSLSLSAVPEASQASAWVRALADHGIDHLPAEDLGPLVRPGLVIGDMVDTVTEALAGADVDGAEVTIDNLAAALASRTRAELADLAEPLRAGASSPPAVAALDAAARDMLRAEGEVDDWGLARVALVKVARGAIAVVGGTDDQRLAAVARVASRLGTAAWQVDLADLCQQPVVAVRSYLEALAGAAGRAGAVVYLDSGDVLRPLAPGPIPYAVGDLLSAPTTVYVVGADRMRALPSPVRRALGAIVDLAPAEEGAA